MLTSSSALVSLNGKHMDADAQARGMLDRFAIDLGQVVKRSDASYYLKDSVTTVQSGNDQLAFFSVVPVIRAVPRFPQPQADLPGGLPGELHDHGHGTDGQRTYLEWRDGHQHAGGVFTYDDSGRLASGDEYEYRFELRVNRTGNFPV